jgi:hypothetical protein
VEGVTPAGLAARWWAPRLLGVLLVALWARLAIWSQVFVGDAVLPRYPDTYYHLRQILRAVESFPRVPVRDPLLNWPEGGFSVWAPGFDWMGAALALALGAADDPSRAAHVAAFLPILLGLACVGAVVWLTRRLAATGPHGAAAALCAGLLWALLPNAVVISRLGRIDHHVAEALAMALLGGWVVWAARERGAPRPRPSRWLLFECAGAACALWASLVFSGSVLYVAIAAALLIALQLAEPAGSPRSLLGSGAPALAVAALALAACAVPAVAVHGERFDFRFPSFLQPALYGVAAFGCLAAALLSCTFAGEARAVRRLLARAGVGGAALALFAALAALALPDASRGVLRGLSEFVGRRDPWLAGVGEFQPLFSSWALWRWSSWDAVYRMHGLFGLLAPVALACGCALALRRHRASGLCFSGWTLALVVLTLLQARFGRLLTVNLAVCWALLLVWIAERAAARLPQLRPGGVWIGVLVLCAALDPVTRAGFIRQPARDPSPLESASFYLREAGGAGGGVLAPWEWGNTLLALSGRPVVSAGFGPYVGAEAFREVEASLAGDEGALLELMARRRLGWLATGRSAFGDRESGPFPLRGGEFVLDVDYFRRVPLGVLALGGGGAAAQGVAHAAHLLPRFASRERYTELPLPVFRLWLFERVRGARIEGAAPPGARVVARTQLRVHGTALAWEAWADADAAGRYRIAVPLPNGLQDPPLETAPAYEVGIEGAPPLALAVSERDVRDGRTLRVQPLTPESSALAPGDGDD